MVAVASFAAAALSRNVAAQQPASEAIVFRSIADGNSEIYLGWPAGGPNITLTRNDVFDINPSLSPDGTRVLFESQTGPTWRDIMVLDLTTGIQTGTLTNLTNVPSESPYYNVDPSWSPDGNAIVFATSRHGPTTMRST